MIKKLNILLLVLAAVVGMTSCANDEKTVMHKPSGFVLNTPAFAQQIYDLEPGGTMQVTYSQPNYGGMALAVTYSVQVSLTEDFANFSELTSKYSSCVADIPQEQVALALCSLRGIETPDQWEDVGPQPLYVRMRAIVNDVADSEIISNVVKFEKVHGYFAVPTADKVWLVGAPNGWPTPAPGNPDLDKWALQETSVGSKVYTATFDIPADSFTFRFYDELDGWEDSSIGAGHPDDDVTIEFTDGVYEGKVFTKESDDNKGKGKWHVDGWAGGTISITLNMINKTVKFQMGGDPTKGKPYIYLIGACGGWTAPEEANEAALEAWKLYDIQENGIYTATFDIPAGEFMFKFYTKLTGWDGGDAMGAQVDDANVDITFTDGVFEGPVVAGKGNYNCPDWEGGKVAMTINTKAGTAIFTKK